MSNPIEDRSPPRSRTVELICEFFQSYPYRSVVVVLGLLIAGAAEGLSVASFLPLFGVLAGNETGGNTLALYMTELLAQIHLEPTIPTLLAMISTGICLKAFLTLCSMFLVASSYAQVATDLRLSLLQNLMRARWSHFTSRPAGTFANALSVEVHTGTYLYVHVARLTAAALMLPVYGVLGFLISWQVTLCAVIAGSVMIGALSFLVRMARTAGRRQADRYNSIVRMIGDLLASIKPLKAMALQGNLESLLARDAILLSRALRLSAMASFYNKALREPIAAAFLCLGFLAALRFGDFTLEVLLVFALIFYRCVNHMATMQWLYQVVAGDERFYFSVREKIDDAARAREEFGGVLPIQYEREVELRDVSVRLGSQPVLRDVSLAVPFGRATVLIGPSGAGKTTILDVILGLHQPDKGKVLIDGVDLRDVDMDRWRSMIGYVPQDTTLLNDTIRQNLVLGDSGVTEKGIWQALARAGADRFVRERKGALDSTVGEHGSHLSGGERQRLAIARALLREPRLLVLDEATSSLDPVTEAEICATIGRIATDLAVLAITHRPALLSIAKIVYRVEHGQVRLLPANDIERLRSGKTFSRM